MTRQKRSQRYGAIICESEAVARIGHSLIYRLTPMSYRLCPMSGKMGCTPPGASRRFPQARKRGKCFQTRFFGQDIDWLTFITASFDWQRKTHRFLVIARLSKVNYVEFHDRTKMFNGGPARKRNRGCPPVLTDNGMAFADLRKSRNGVSCQWGPNNRSRGHTPSSWPSASQPPSPSIPVKWILSLEGVMYFGD